MKLSERLKQDAEDIWNDIYQHPFVVELCKGTLPIEKFKYYVLQDYNYLINSIKNFSLLASKAKTTSMLQELVEIAAIEAKGEFSAYNRLLKKLDLSIEDAKNSKRSLAEVSYSSFLLSTTENGSFEEGIAAVLPCYWSYAEIAKCHREKILKNSNQIYKEWASYYLEEEYLELVERIKKSVDNIEKDFPYDKLRSAFINSSRYEYEFWREMNKVRD